MFIVSHTLTDKMSNLEKNLDMKERKKEKRKSLYHRDGIRQQKKKNKTYKHKKKSIVWMIWIHAQRQ